MSAFPAHFQPFGTVADRLEIAEEVGTELIQRAASVQIAANLPVVTERSQATWDARDRGYAEALGLPYDPVVIPTVEPRNFFTGQKPSLVEAPLEFWPSVTCYCLGGAPSRSQADQFDQYDAVLFVEVLCAVGPLPDSKQHDAEGIDAESRLDRIVERLSDSVHICMRSDRTLGATLAGEFGPMSFDKSPPFSRKVEHGSGQVAIHQGRQFRYPVSRNVY